MDDCFGDTVIDEDQIVFDFGDGDFELKQSKHHDSLQCSLDFVPTVGFEGVPDFLPPTCDPVKDQTLNIKSHNLDLREGKDLEIDSSQVLLSAECSRNLFAEVSKQDDAILSKPGEPSSGNLHQTLSSSDCNLENSEASIFPLSDILTAYGQIHPVNVFRSTVTSPLSSPTPPPPHPPPPPVPVPSPPPPRPPQPPRPPPRPFSAVSSPFPSPPVSNPPFPDVSSPSFPPVPSSPPAFPPVSSPEQPPFSSLPDGHDLTQPNETAEALTSSFQFTRDPVWSPLETVSIQPSSNFSHPPTTNPFQQTLSSAPLPHLPSNDDDDDEFDFDELIASRTQLKPKLQLSETKVEEEEKEFAAAVEFDVDVGSKTKEFQTKDSEDNSIAVPPPGQRSEEALERASNEWDRVETIEPDFEESQGVTLKARAGTEPITFGEAVAFLNRTKLMQQFGASIRTSVVRGTLAALFHRLCGGPRLVQRLQAERDFAFCLAACPFNNEESIHCRVLFSIYKQLTGSKFDCARFGSHWEIIGFQGQDPATDLRGAGFLALLQLLHLVTDLKTQVLARSIYRLSLHETQNFPFCLMGINLTRITMAAMREDRLNKECNRRGQVLGVLNDFYVGLFHRMQVVWKTEHKTIRDTGFVLADLESYAKKHSQEMVRTITQIQSMSDTPFRHQENKTTRDIAHIDEHLF